METVYVACAVAVAVAVLVAAVYLVVTLNQLRKTARQAEELIANLNRELASVSKVTGFVSSLVERFTTPWFKAGSWLASAVASYVMNRSQKNRAPEPAGKVSCNDTCCAAEGGKHV